ncbi:MAG: hypothetical protein IPK83_08570 [Planctomycetes bacterium]|nr:hypothetical protein [Planctomycetota bacterium]
MHPETPLLCIVGYPDIEGPLNWPEVWRSICDITTIAGVQPTHIQVATVGHHKIKPAMKIGKHSINQLGQALLDADCCEVDIYGLDTDSHFMYAPLIIAVRMTEEKPCKGVFVMHVKLDNQLHMQELSGICRSVFDHINGVLGISQGLVHCMRANQYPTLYFDDAPYSPHLSDAEEENVRLWEVSRHHSREVVRGVFWGNLLTSGHWAHSNSKRDAIVADLRAFNVHLHELSGGRLFFHAPLNLMYLYDKESRFIQYANDVRKILANHGIHTVHV